MMWYWGNGVHWWGWLVGALAMVAFWSLVVWAIWYFVTAVARRPGQGPGPGPDGPPGPGVPGGAKRILDERLARGDIDPEEYRRLLDLIRGGDARSSGERTTASKGTDVTATPDKAPAAGR